MNGKVLIGQSGGPTAVINASIAGVIDRVRSLSPETPILGMNFAVEGFMEEKLIELSTLSNPELKRLKETPGSALGSCRYKLQDEDLGPIVEKLKDLDIRYIFLAGGNDTMDTIHRISAYAEENGYELCGIGIPKTVDNDLYGTDHTPGYGSAGRYTALSVLQSGQLARDMQRVDRFVIHQTVGREAGWLAASAAVAKREEGDAPHLIYLPERPITVEKVLSDVQTTVDRYGFCSIVCGEGVLWQDGSPVSAGTGTDKFANTEFGAMGGGSAALTLHGLIRESTGYRGEFQVTESLSMCADDRVGPFDREEAFRCGKEAVNLAADGVNGFMVTMERAAGPDYRIDYGRVPLHEVAVRAKPMPDEFTNSAGNGVSEAFLNYARPLIGEMPRYQRLF